jgi:hypothetical protein
MIVRREGGSLWLFMQTDHARLAGVMASHWGNEAFAPPVMPERTAQAIGQHDDGWLAWEADPRVNRQTDRPYHFLEMALDDILQIWYLGPKKAGEADPYRGILLSRHGSYLLGRILARDAGSPEENQRLRQYLQDQETLRERLSARLERTEPETRAGLLAGVDHAYRLLQICDDLSLRFCTGPLQEGVVEAVPRSGMNDLTPLAVHPMDERTLRLDPWPFDTPELLLPVTYVCLPDRRYTTYADLKTEMLNAGPSFVTFRLARG